MTTAEDARKLRDWILENAGLEAQSMPVAIRIRILRLMDRDRWEAYAREHTLSTWEEGVELVLSYLEAAINEPAAQVCLLTIYKRTDYVSDDPFYILAHDPYVNERIHSSNPRMPRRLTSGSLSSDTVAAPPS
ncbi:UNVERIFIED_CONTAM: hypothetical protein FKN15_061955 [Acipenser sinensis]